MAFILLFQCPSLAQSDTSSDNDQLLTAQLRKAFRQVEGLDQVTLEVRGGVAVLRGEVPTLETRMKAEELAARLEGILTVDNGLQIESELGERLSPAVSNLYDKARALWAFGPLAGVALLIFLLSLTAGRVLTRWEWPYSRISQNLFVRDLVKQFVYFLCVLLGAVMALELLDATALVGAVLGTAGVLGVAIGFAFKDLAENSLASILLSIRQPFAPNDHVVIDGQEGKIVRLTSRATILLTLDGNHLRIPNAAVFKATILNFSRNPDRRFLFNLGVDTSEDLAQAQALAVQTLREAPGVSVEPAPQCLIEEFGDWTVKLLVVAWIDQRKNDYVKVKSEAMRRVKEAFDEAGIVMPEPIYKVRMDSPGSDPVKVRKVPGLSFEEPDLIPETHLDERIDQERAARADMLDEEAVRE
ncbi:MAG: mechanosensitive ion channel family protein [Vulcanimicrobiota bacterium]